MQNQDIRRAFQLMENYSPRQIELILTPVEQLSRYPSEKELGQLLNKVIAIDDFDTLSEINSKYDLDFSSDEDKDERTVIEEEVREAERRFIEMMQTINPNWTILFISLSKNYIKKDCFQ